MKTLPCMPNPREVLRKFSSPGVVLILGVVLFVVGAKFSLIQKYGSDLPFWDQWDAEADRLYIPAAEGRLHTAEFFAPHNEHHIVFTKLLAFSLLKLNGQWDARLQMTVNACLHGSGIALLLASIRRQAKPYAFMAAALLALPLFGLPFTWENTLAGFQSQFYFLLLFSLLHLAGTFLSKPRSLTLWLAQAAGLAAVFAMASGFFSAAVVFGVTATRACIRKRATKEEAVLLLLNALLIGAGLALKTRVPGHEALKSSDLSTFFASFSLLTAWPSPWAVVCPLTLIPFVVSVIRQLRAPKTEPNIVFLLALGGWWILQVVAIAYARGGDAHGVAPRYFDTLAVGTLIGIILWLETLSSAVRGRFRPVVLGGFVLWLLALGFGFRFQTRETYRMFLIPFTEVNPKRIETVSQFVANADKHFYEARPWLDIPYPEPDRLARLLLNPRLRAVLPVSVRPSLPVVAETNSSKGFTRNGSTGAEGFPPGRQDWTSFGRSMDVPAEFRSKPITSSGSRFLRLWVHGQLGSSEGSLYLETPSHRLYLEAPAGAREMWKSVVVTSPGVPFRIVAESRAGSALAFTEPVELALGSWLTSRILRTGTPLIWIGSLLVVVGMILHHRPLRANLAPLRGRSL